MTRTRPAFELTLYLALLIAAEAMVAGCAHVFGPTVPVIKPGQMDAMDVVWRQAYGRTDEPPAVEWVEGDALDCYQQPRGAPGFVAMTATGKACVGDLVVSPFVVRVAYSGRPWHLMAFAHGLYHVLLLRELVVDPRHYTEGWRTLVVAANAALERLP